MTEKNLSILSLEFQEGGLCPTQLKVQLARPPATPSPEEIAATVKKLESKLLQAIPIEEPVVGVEGTAIRAFVEWLQEISSFPERIRRYEEDVTAYLRDYPRYVELDYESREYRARIKLEIGLANNGQAEAQDCIVVMHFPGWIQLSDKKPLPYKIPEPPTLRPNSTVEEWEKNPPYARIKLAGDYKGRNVQPRLQNVFGPKITKLDHIHVRFEVGAIRPRRKISLDPLWVIFPDYESVRSFEVSYSIVAGNCEETSGGALRVLIDKV